MGKLCFVLRRTIVTVVLAAFLLPGFGSAQERVGGHSAPAVSSAAWVTDSVCPDDAHAAFHACATEAAKTFEPPRTPDGQPNLSGIWRRRAAAHESLQSHPRTLDDFGAASIVVDPSDGIVPLQPWAEAQRRYNRSAYIHHNAICRLDGLPVTMYMTGTYQFMQSSGYFLVQGEEAHAYRVVSLDDRPHIGRRLKLWNGDSVGRWEGNTLVVETANQNARPWLDQRGRFYTDEARVEERFTLIDANTIHWQATIDDSNVYTSPFTIALAYRRSTVEDFEIWEEACFEDNDLSAEMFMNVGYKVYAGITGDEARRFKVAWELEEGER